MFENIKGIEIEGGCFEPSTKLNFFDENNIAVIYGANGSGKSSIANALSEYKNNNLIKFSKVELLNKNNKKITKSEIELNRLHIFNEQFINENVKFTEDDKLNSIVLLGKIVELDNEISKLEETKKKQEQLLETYKNNEKNLTNKKSDDSYEYWKEQIKNFLKENGGWAERESKIKGNKTSSDVNESTVNHFIELNKYKDININIEKNNYEKKIIELDKTKDAQEINSSIQELIIDENIDTEIHQLLDKKIEKPNLSEREKTIFKILNNQKNNNKIDEIKEEFNSDTDICPFCFQKVSENYKNDLLKSIANIFNTKEAKEHQDHLEKINMCDINNIDLEEYNKIDENIVKNIEGLISNYKEYIKEVTDKINEKKTNIYRQINFKSDLVSKQKEINELLQSLEKKREQFNTNIKNNQKLITELQEINKKLAYAELKELNYINKYKTCKKNYDDNHKDKEHCEQEINKLNIEINKSNSKKNNTKLAVDIINKQLSYIFFSNDRLKIEIENNKYAVKVKDKQIKLKNLSEGEKNAIALCYFFSTINQNKQEKDFFKHECLIVLDDPISSFDFNNKIGIYTFLRHTFDKILTNNNSRILVFTHQIEAMFQIRSVIEEIKAKSNCFILDNHKLCDFKIYKDKFNAYNKILNEIFTYANNENNKDVNHESIGNSMRKIVESFSLFNYKLSINDFFRDVEILNIINDDEKKDFFQNFMIRLILHGESHFEDQTKTITENNFYDYISPEEKKKSAKYLLIFLKLLNKLHLQKHLNNKDNIDIINDWEKELFTDKKYSK